MKKKVIRITIVTILLILLFPIRNQLKDGGTVEWESLTYKVSKVHRLNFDSKTGYDDGMIIEVLGIKVYDSVVVGKSNMNHEDEVKKITWEEITSDGVNEELLIKNVDEELLTQIATELQTLMKEEEAEERENPEIVIIDGWTRVFKSERYTKILNMGDSAMKPLYLILYKSPNAGMYEYVCANALYQLSGYDFEWSTSKEFLEKFNEKKLLESNL